MSEFEGKSFRMVEKDDLDYVTGGAKVTESIDPRCKEKLRSNKCNCGKFEPRETWMTLNICDNCKNAGAKNEDASKVFCSVELI